jgi:hypothetical protein
MNKTHLKNCDRAVLCKVTSLQGQPLVLCRFNRQQGMCQQMPSLQLIHPLAAGGANRRHIGTFINVFSSI